MKMEFHTRVLGEKTRMYEQVKTWNPFVGCRHNCSYCVRSFQRQMKRRKRDCELCYLFVPHFHCERLERIPNSKLVFACAFGDIAFAEAEHIKEIFEQATNHSNKTFMFQSKNPYVFHTLSFPISKNILLGTTIETNRSIHIISNAPHPLKRFEAMKSLLGARKFVTIEPILDFDLEELVSWIAQIKPEFVYVGYDNHNCHLDEPSPEKTAKLIHSLSMFTDVRLKTIKPALSG